MGEEITVSTWPYAFKSFYGYRNFTIEDEKGEVVAYANSVWIFLDTDSGRPKRVSEEMLKAYVFEEQYPMGNCGAQDPSAGRNGCGRTVCGAEIPH